MKYQKLAHYLLACVALVTLMVALVASTATRSECVAIGSVGLLAFLAAVRD